MLQCVLFDLDGTLTDPKEGITKSVQFALYQQGIKEPDLDKLEPFIGPPLKDSFMAYYGLSAEAAEKAIVDYRSRFSPIGIFENKVYAGIPQMLRKLKDAGMHLAVASSKPEVFVNRILEHFELAEYFDVVVGSLLDGGRVEKEEVVAEALSRLGEVSHCKVNRETCAMVGDRKFDVYGGKEHGLTTVAVAYGYAGKGELEEAEPDYIARNVKALEAFLLGENPSGNAGNRYTKADGKATFPVKDSAFYKTCHVLAPFLLYYLGYNVCYFILAVIIQGISSMGTAAGQWLQQNSTLVVNIGKACSMLTGAGFLLRSFSEERTNWQGDKKIPYLPLGVAAATAAVGTNILFFLLHITESSAAYEQTALLQYRIPFIQGLLLYGIISPLAEEILFRGLIYNRLKKFFPIGISMVASAALFGLYHGNMVQALYGILLGLLIAYGYEITGHFAVPVFMHGIANAVVFALTYDAKVSASVGTPANCVVLLAIATVCIWRMNPSINLQNKR